MPWSKKTEQLYHRRTKRLNKHVIEWVDNLTNVPPQWRGPSLYFHKVLVQMANDTKEVKERSLNLGFIERLYACLTSWGIHRFDNPNARLVEFDDFRNRVVTISKELNKLSQIPLHQLSVDGFNEVLRYISQEIDDLHIVKTGWPLVANSKLLHHLFPHLIPPIDRKYTLNYFIRRKDDSNNTVSYTFGKIFKSYWEVAVSNAEELEKRCVDSWEIPIAWNTTIPKLIDNALVVAL